MGLDDRAVGVQASSGPPLARLIIVKQAPSGAPEPEQPLGWTNLAALRLAPLGFANPKVGNANDTSGANLIKTHASSPSCS